jgi:8-oxo-dGTP pyrophosphatase MutT (NUDIX family)
MPNETSEPNGRPKLSKRPAKFGSADASCCGALLLLLLLLLLQASFFIFFVAFSGDDSMARSCCTYLLALTIFNSAAALSHPMEHHHHIERLRSFGRPIGAPSPSDNAERDDRPRASVLVPLFEHADNNEDGGAKRTHVLLTKRPENLKSHPGQVCFPGGRQEEGDNGDDCLTALRETKEEVGLDHDRIEPICTWSSIESVNGLCVTPVIARIMGPLSIPSDLTLCPREVEAAFAVPLEYFTDAAGNVAECKDIDWKGSKYTLRTYYYTCPTSRNEYKIWGLTAGIIHHVAQVAYGAGGANN